MARIYTAESVPPNLVKDLLETNWVSYRNMPKPDFIVVNDDEDARARFEFSSNDVITIMTGGPEIIKYRGNVHYYDRACPIILNVWTKYDRQRLRDIWRQIKGIIFDHLFAIAGYQIIKIQSYTEITNDALNIWKSEIRLTLESAGVCVETNGDYDRFNV